MSEESVTGTAVQPPSDERSAGSMLRAAREATGLHIAALAVAMKVPVKKLEALEADRLDELPDAVFVRALAGSMCRALKIDPAPVLSRLPHSAARVFDRDDRGINMPYSTSGLVGGNSLKAFAARPAVLAVLGLLVAALVVAFYPQPDAGESSPAVEATPTLPDVVPAVPPAVVSAPSPYESNAPATLPSPAGLASVAPVAAVAAPVASAPAAPVVVSSPTVSASDIVVFKATSSAWVRVSDSQGKVQFERTLAAGESASASGTLPLSIVLGNVSATELLVRGQPFALNEVAKNNVARFEVK